jgi:hypothetical protein
MTHIRVSYQDTGYREDVVKVGEPVGRQYVRRRLGETHILWIERGSGELVEKKTANALELHFQQDVEPTLS